MTQARMNHPVMVVPDAMKALQALGDLTKNGLPEKLLELVHLRASQINGCSACVDMHPKLAKKAGETDERLFAVAAWRETPYFSDGERACPATTLYRSAQAHGTLEEVTSRADKARVLQALMEKYQPEGKHVPIDHAPNPKRIVPAA